MPFIIEVQDRETSKTKYVNGLPLKYFDKEVS